MSERRLPKYQVGQQLKTRTGKIWTIAKPGRYNTFWQDIDYPCVQCLPNGQVTFRTSLLESEVTPCDVPQ